MSAAAGKRYKVWVGTEKIKERIVLETDDIEEAARTAAADKSGCTFWGMQAGCLTLEEKMAAMGLHHIGESRDDVQRRLGRLVK